jgi:hypothetical protein
MILWKHEYKWVFIDFLSKVLMSNELFFYLKCILNSRILIQNPFWICIWLQYKSCSFCNVLKSNQLSFEAVLLRIYCVTCFDPFTVATKFFLWEILESWRHESATVHFYGNPPAMGVNDVTEPMAHVIRIYIAPF